MKSRLSITNDNVHIRSIRFFLEPAEAASKMTLPAVNISSDSDSSSSDASLSIYRKGPKIRKIVTDRKISLSDVQSPTPATNNADNQAAADARGNKSVNEAVPLFKITFRDELTSG